jgi:hypothetical protein
MASALGVVSDTVDVETMSSSVSAAAKKSWLEIRQVRD